MKFGKIVLGVSIFVLTPLTVTFAADNDSERELVVYSIGNYGKLLDLGETPPQLEDWKSHIVVKYEKNPYHDFFQSMAAKYDHQKAYLAHDSSARFQDEDVTVDQMVSTGETRQDRGWSGSDMVFFQGHNTQMQPQWHHSFSIWKRFALYNPITYSMMTGWHGTGVNKWQEWGTSKEPYMYHRYEITDASLQNAYSVFYAWTPLTSVLIGKDFPRTGGTWETENQKDGAIKTNTNTLGPETEWVIGHGCNAVTVAYPHGEYPTPLGVNAWRKSWNGLHLVLGHYDGIDVATEPDLNPFATSLKAGATVKDAYFDAHKDYYNGQGHQAVIGTSSKSCCSEIHLNGMPILACPTVGCGGSHIEKDTWTKNNMSDPSYGQYYFVTEWAVAE
ncbi:MAG: hypothetical protein HN348_05150 [Proteobacteria bacterium]|nr:hypothetical protein [Pseudomonadota bacterium]